MSHNFPTRLTANGHLCCFHVLAIENSAAMNTGVHACLSILPNFCNGLLTGIPSYTTTRLYLFLKFHSDLHSKPSGFLIIPFFLNFLLEYSWFTVLCLRSTAKWMLYIHIYPLLKDSFPMQIITEYWVELPVLYNRSLLVIYFI